MDRTLIEKTEELLSNAKTPAEKVYLSAFLDGAKAQKEEDHRIILNISNAAEKGFFGGVQNG